MMATVLPDKTFDPRTRRMFLVLFLCLGTVIGGMVAVFYQLQAQSYLKQLLVREEAVVQTQRRAVDLLMETVMRDIAFLSGIHELEEYFENGTEQDMALLTQEFDTFARAMRIYDQVRLLSNTGMELVRVNFAHGRSRIVPIDKLQDKSDRYYFTGALAQGEGRLYVSPLDLNMENGRVEMPYKPMIRIAMPIHDDMNRLRGMVVLNYLAQQMLDRIEEISTGSEGSPLLLNSSGHRLLDPVGGRAWGFMFPDRVDDSFAKEHPDIWGPMSVTETGHLETAEGLYVFTTIHPLRKAPANFTQSRRKYVWKVVSFVPKEAVAHGSRGLLTRIFMLGGGLFLFTALLSWFLAKAIVKRRQYQERLVNMAHYDALTGLPNRTLFFDRLQQVHDTSVRYKHCYAIIYLDLDGFKDVNDTHGHEAGDELLLGVGKRLLDATRRSDTAARLGGDEFALILPEIKSAESASLVARKVLNKLSLPFQLSMCTAKVGASMGIALFPNHGDESEELVKLADAAMYQSKAAGKNTITLAEKG